MLQMQLDELRAGIDDAKAMAVQAGNMPRQAAGGEEAENTIFSFLTTDDNGGAANEAPSLTMEPGDVHFGPDETTAWADPDFTGESTTVTPTASNTAWYVWLVIDVESLAVTWKEGATITALTDEEKLTKINWPLVKVTLEWSEGGLGTVTAVKHLQCGDVMVSRAAG